MHFTELPTLGVGLSADVASQLPNFRLFLGDCEDSIDYLSFGAHHVQKARIEHYIGDLVQTKLPLVYHPINFNVALNESEDQDVRLGIRDITEYSKAVWAGQDIGVWTYGNQYLGAFLVPVIFDEESAEEVARKVESINGILPCPFLIENPPVNFSLETMHMLDFMRLVAEKADCGFVLDIGHLIGYQQATNRDPNDIPVDTFPWDRVIEVHVAGLQFSQIGPHLNIIDHHSSPVHEVCWEFLRAHAHRMTGLKGITLEQEYCEDHLVREHLRKARQITNELGVFQNAN